MKLGKDKTLGKVQKNAKPKKKFITRELVLFYWKRILIKQEIRSATINTFSYLCYILQ